MIIREVPGILFAKATLAGENACDVFYESASRINREIDPQIREKRKGQTAGLPWTVEDTKRHLKRDLQEDELLATEMLQAQGSIEFLFTWS